MSEQKEQGLTALATELAARMDAILEAQAAENAELRADRDRAQSACTAWQQVFESIEAHLQDRIAMDDPGQPETYLSIIRGDVAGVLRASEQIVAARWAHYRMHEARATAAEKALATAREDALEEAAKLAKLCQRAGLCVPAWSPEERHPNCCQRPSNYGDPHLKSHPRPQDEGTQP